MKKFLLKEELDNLKTLKLKFQEEGKEILKKAFKKFFDENKDVKNVTWTQYTSYWNDGEPTSFGVCEMFPISNEDNDQEDQSFENEDKVISMIQELESIPDDIFLDMFGDHVSITATPDGFTVEDYSDHE